MITVTSLVIFLLMPTIPLWEKMDISSINKNNNKTVIFNNKINMIEKDNSASKGGRQLTKDPGILGANSDILIGGTVWVFKEVLIQALGDP